MKNKDEIPSQGEKLTIKPFKPNQIVYELDDVAWEEFCAELNATPKNNPRLKDLLSRKPVWQE